jgi:hypothetical protein
VVVICGGVCGGGGAWRGVSDPGVVRLAALSIALAKGEGG